uniref:Protein-glucosylgalactosylhydroxylysine glucosidase n=1 Tax=Latimeria chalumnae TaxID=7897 RepID=H3BDF9_LATCH
LERVDDDPAVFTSDRLPSDPRFLATVANGYLGTRMYGDVLHVNGVYNGSAKECHRADVPSTINVKLNMPNEKSFKQTFTLNTRTGTFSHTLACQDYVVTQRIFAHRSFVNLLVFSVSVQRLVASGQPIAVQLLSSFSPQSPDIDFKSGPDFKGGRYVYGETLIPEVEHCPQSSVHMIWTPAPKSLTLPVGKQRGSWVFLTAVAESASEAQSCFSEGLSMIATSQLYPSHRDAWAELWRTSCVEVEGHFFLSQALYGCFYYLFSSLPPLKPTDFLFNGISPGGLSNGSKDQDYWGHVFWDQDIWMYPNVLLFYPELARAILKYRISTLKGALANAQQQGHKGAKYPWESAVTGYEVCPEAIYGTQEIHITGDVSFAFQLYFYFTQDLELFRKDGGWEVIAAIAEYWSSRVTWNAAGSCYDIKGVMPPDEYYSSVNNSVYTNVVAKYSLEFAVNLASKLQIPIPPEWLKIAEKIKVPFDLERQYHPEFDGYRLGKSVKQADAVLLGFPLMYPMSLDVRKNDLEIYEAVTSPEGPAMTWSMFAVGWMELKESKMAQNQLKKCFSNIQEPFKIWTECSNGSGAVNFLTGMGGFLQAVLFGYTGFRITKVCLYFDPMLPEDIRELKIIGVHYLGNKLDFTLTKDTVTVELTRIWVPQHSFLEIVLNASAKRFPLNEGHPVTFAFGAGKVQKQTS